jgi:hypothetical protein
LRILAFSLMALFLVSGIAVACGCNSVESPGCSIALLCADGCFAICGAGACTSECTRPGTRLQDFLMNNAGISVPTAALAGWPEGFGDRQRIERLGAVLAGQARPGGEAGVGAILIESAGRSTSLSSFLDVPLVKSLTSRPGTSPPILTLSQDDQRFLEPILSAIQGRIR